MVATLTLLLPPPLLLLLLLLLSVLLPLLLQARGLPGRKPFVLLQGRALR